MLKKKSDSERFKPRTKCSIVKVIDEARKISLFLIRTDTSQKYAS